MELSYVTILTFQGAFIEHEDRIREADNGQLKYSSFQIRTADDIDNADGIILPGGESTAMRIIGLASENQGSMLYE